jgi:hypothetical protein
MGLARRGHLQTRSENKPDYWASFLHRSHSILRMGYARLHAPSSFAERSEEDITGELVAAMRAAVEDPAAPAWGCFFWVHEEVRVSQKGRTGKRRKRIDIEIMQNGRSGPRPRFCFEAKRLHSAASRGVYLGPKGLGRFLKGSYAKNDDTAGMLGYVQEGTVASQANALGQAIQTAPGRYGVTPNGDWASHSVVDELTTFRSKHRRATPLPSITLFHTLLLFC